MSTDQEEGKHTWAGAPGNPKLPVANYLSPFIDYDEQEMTNWNGNLIPTAVKTSKNADIHTINVYLQHTNKYIKKILSSLNKGPFFIYIMTALILLLKKLNYEYFKNIF